MRPTLTCISVCMAMLMLGCTLTHAHVSTIPFDLGDEIKLECRRNLTSFPAAFTGRLPPKPVEANSAPGGSDAHGIIVDDTEHWGPGIICAETGKELSFNFGKDGFVYCGWRLENEDTYNFARSVMAQESGWNCRVPMSKDKSFYMPVVIPLWGVVEPTHLHVNYHMNFVFHVDEGRIIGVTAYPVRDRFQFGRIGSMINLHGPVKWFSKHTYASLSGVTETMVGTQIEGTGMIGVMRQEENNYKNRSVRVE